MATIAHKLHEIDSLNTLQQRNQWMNKIHPLVKFALSIFYIIVTMSVGKYQLDKMLVLAIYPIFAYQLADLSIGHALERMKLILPLVLAVGIFNPFFDKIPVYEISGIVITSGMISMVTLMLKGIYTVLAAYLLIATTSIEEICYAMQLLHFPAILITVFLLIYRYIFIMGEEAERIMTAYQLRAPSQKGLNYKAWGPLVGQWLIRSMDRAGLVYDSMMLRGFKGTFATRRKYHVHSTSIIYFVVWVVALGVLRWTDIITLLGSLFV